MQKAGYEPGKDFMIAMDAASSEWKTGKVGEYKLPKAGTVYTSDELIAHWKKLVEKLPEMILNEQISQKLFERDYTQIAEEIRNYKKENSRVRRRRK